MKAALVLRPVKGNNYGTLNSVVDMIIESIQSQFFTKCITTESSTLLVDILEVGSSASNLIIWCYFGYDLKINALNLNSNIRIAGTLRAKQVIIIDDPPYYNWMYTRVRDFLTDTPATNAVIMSTETFEKDFKCLYDSKQQVKVLQFPALCRDRSLAQRPFVDREFDLIAPITFGPIVNAQHVHEGFNRFGDFGNFIANASLFAVTNYPDLRAVSSLQIMIRILEDLSLKYHLSAQSMLTNQDFLHAIEIFDQYRRYSNRVSVIKQIISSMSHQLILFTPIPDEVLKYSDRVLVFEPMDISHLISLMENCRYLLDIQIPGQNGIHQRAKTALSIGTGLISDGPISDGINSPRFCWYVQEVSDAIFNNDYNLEWKQRTREGFKQQDIYSTRRFGRDLFNYFNSLYVSN